MNHNLFGPKRLIMGLVGVHRALWGLVEPMRKSQKGT